jgi:anti-sigma B factor antagonist
VSNRLQYRGSAGGTTTEGDGLTDESAGPLRAHPVLSVERMSAGILVRLTGELDLYNAEDLRAALAQAIDERPERLVVDLSQVEFLDSTALGVLIEARSRLGRGGLVLASPQIETRRALQVSGLDRHLAVHDSVEDAFS